MITVLTPTQDKSKLRRIKAINRGQITPNVVLDRPELRYIKLYKLYVNDDYQRSLSERSMGLIRNIIKNFSWSKYHAPVVVQITPDTGDDDDTYEILDGQHTATGAVSHGGIREIPCLVVKADTLEDKAEAFVGLNKDKVHMTPMQIFWAEVTAGKEEAIDTARGAELAGATIVKRMPPYGEFSPGETVSVGSLQSLARRGGVPFVKRVLEVGVQAQLAPISRDFIIAFDHLLLKKGPFLLEGSYEDIKWKVAQVVRSLGTVELIDRATMRRRSVGETIGYNIAYLIKREIDETHCE